MGLSSRIRNARSALVLVHVRVHVRVRVVHIAYQCAFGLGGQVMRVPQQHLQRACAFILQYEKRTLGTGARHNHLDDFLQQPFEVHLL